MTSYRIQQNTTRNTRIEIYFHVKVNLRFNVIKIITYIYFDLSICEMKRSNKVRMVGDWKAAWSYNWFEKNIMENQN